MDSLASESFHYCVDKCFGRRPSSFTPSIFGQYKLGPMTKKYHVDAIDLIPPISWGMVGILPRRVADVV